MRRVSSTVDDVLIAFCFGRLKIEVVVLKKKLRLKLSDYCTHGHASYDLFEHKKLYIYIYIYVCVCVCVCVCVRARALMKRKMVLMLSWRVVLVVLNHHFLEEGSPFSKLAKPIRSHSLVGMFNFLPIELGAHTSWYKSFNKKN